jgi:hypothetical protein
MTEVLAVQGAAEVVGMTEAQLRHAVANGKVIPEAVVAGHALWRRSTLERWAKSSKRTFPISPPLEVVGLGGLAERFGVSVAAIRKWRYDGKLPPPDHQPSTLLLWDEATVRKMTPTCQWCMNPIDVVEVNTIPGGRTRVRCSCSDEAWTVMRAPLKGSRRTPIQN